MKSKNPSHSLSRLAQDTTTTVSESGTPCLPSIHHGGARALLTGLAALTICAIPAFAQSGSTTWNGAVDGDYFNGGNWANGQWPNGNATFAGNVNTTITHTPSSGESPYVYGLYFANSLGTDNSFNIGGTQQFNLGGPTVRTTEVTSGSLSDLISPIIALVGSADKTYDIRTNHDLEFSGAIAVGGASHTFTKIGGGTLTLSGNSSFLAGITVSVGTLQLGNGGASGALNPANSIDIQGGTFAINQNDLVTQGTEFSSDPISGSGTFAAMGGATVVITDAATFGNALSVSVASDSFLNLDYVGTDVVAGLDLGAGPVVSGEYGATSSGAQFESDRITGTGRIYVSGSRTWDGSTDMTWTSPDSTSWSGETYLDTDNVTFGDTGAGTVTISGVVTPGNVTVNNTVDYTFSGDSIDGAGSLIKSGNATLTLSDANTFTGGSSIDGGFILMNHGDALGTGTITISSANPGELRLADGITVDEPITLNGSGGGPEKLRSLGTSTLTGLVTVNGLARIAGGTINYEGGMTSTSTQLFVGNANFNTNPLTLGSSELWQHVSNTFFGTTGNTWTKQIVAFGGSTTIGVNDALPIGSSIQFGWGNNPGWNTSTLDLNGFDQEVASIETVSTGLGLVNNQNITGTSGALTVNQTVASKTYEGRITGGVSLVKSGTGTLILNNLSGIPSDYTGTVEIYDGVVESLSGSDFSDAGGVRVFTTTAGALNLNYAGTDTVAVLDLGTGSLPDGVYGAGSPEDTFGVLTGTGTITVVAPPTPPLVWDGSTDSTWTNPDATSWSGETYNNGDDVTFFDAGAGIVTLSGTIEPGSVALDSASDYSFSGDALAGSTDLTKAGTGTLTLTDANTYSGLTAVNGGVLEVLNATSLGSAAAGTTVADGAAVSIQGSISVAEPLDITGNGAGIGALRSNGNNTMSGAITMTGSRIETVDGTGKLILTGGVTGTGASNVLVGDIQADSVIDLGTSQIQIAGSGINFANPGFDEGNEFKLNTTGNAWASALLFFDANVVLGVNDAIPVTSDVIFGFVDPLFSTVQLDLNGFDQTLGSIATHTLGVGGDANITGGGTLTVNQSTNTEYQGRITGSTSLIKSGTGTLTLNNLSGTPSNFTGTTSVVDGTLALNGSSIPDANSLSITGTGQVSVTGIEIVTSLTLGGTTHLSGSFNSGNSSGFITAGTVQVGASAYDTWAATNAPTGTSDDDYDEDGVANGVEFVLGGDKDTNDLGKLPGLTLNGGDMEFSFVRDQASVEASTGVEIEVGTTLASWPASYTVGADTGSSDAGVTVVDNLDGTDTVTLTLTQAPDLKKFARMVVTIPAP